MTELEAREFCRKTNTLLRLADDNSIYFDTDEECSFEIESPSDFRHIGFLSKGLTQTTKNGGLLWFRIMYGADGLNESGIRVLESLRRAHADTTSLNAAPAQLFDNEDELDLQVALMQIIGNGWNAYFVPTSAKFAVSFRSSHRFNCYSDGKAAHDHLMALLKEWSPREVNN